jgi:L-asparagine transporter-like permease
VSNPAFLFALAGVSMSFVGFSSLFVALRRRDTEWQFHEAAEVNGIVLSGLLTLFSALLVVPIASFIGDSAAFRVMSAALLAVTLYVYQVRVESSWLRWSRVRSYASRREHLTEAVPFAFAAIVAQLLLAVNVFLTRQDLYELALTMILVTPALIFLSVVRDFMSTARDPGGRPTNG